MRAPRSQGAADIAATTRARAHPIARTVRHAADPAQHRFHVMRDDRDEELEAPASARKSGVGADSPDNVRLPVPGRRRLE